MVKTNVRVLFARFSQTAVCSVKYYILSPLTEETSTPSSFANAKCSFKEKIRSKPRDQLMQKMKEESNRIPVSLPDQKQVLQTKRFFDINHGSDANTTKHKSCAFSRGFRQPDGSDYCDLYSPITKYNPFFFMLTLSVNLV